MQFIFVGWLVGWLLGWFVFFLGYYIMLCIIYDGHICLNIYAAFLDFTTKRVFNITLDIPSFLTGNTLVIFKWQYEKGRVSSALFK
jgi:hypothetical protein